MDDFIERDMTCSAQAVSGKFCGSASLPDAPFPMCAKHARQAFEFGRQLVMRKSAQGRGRRMDDDVIEGYLAFGDRQDDLKPYRREAKRPCVYFIEISGLIKIGATEAFQRRVLQYPPNRNVLYVHYDSDAWVLERRIQLKFGKHLSRGNEWFEAHQEIVDFIDGLRSGTLNAWN